MIRKFKHKKEPCYLALGDELNGKGEPIEYKLKFKEFDESTIGYLPVDIVENSSDWQPVDIVENSSDWQEITNELVEGRWRKMYAKGDMKVIFRECELSQGFVKGKDATYFHKHNGDFEKYSETIECRMGEILQELPSTHEIHQALDAIRIEKGLVEGVKVKSLSNGRIRTISRIRTIKNKTEYDIDNDSLYIVSEIPEMSNEGRICIYKQGEWTDKKVEEPELIEKRWYKDKYKNIGKWDGEKTLKGELLFRDVYNQNSGIFWTTMVVDLYNDQLKEATTSEIHQALDAIRVYRGLVHGITVNQKHSFLNKDTNKIIKEDFSDRKNGSWYISSEDSLLIWDNRGTRIVLYSNGQWAEKVEEPVLVTEDGKVYDSYEYVFEATPFFNPGIQLQCKEVNECKKHREDTKFFKNKENAQAYIEQHKARFSRADLEWLEDEINRIKIYSGKNLIIGLIRNLKANGNLM